MGACARELEGQSDCEKSEVHKRKIENERQQVRGCEGDWGEKVTERHGNRRRGNKLTDRVQERE